MKDKKRPSNPQWDWFKILQVIVLMLTAISLVVGLVDFEVIAVWFSSFSNSNLRS